MTVYVGTSGWAYPEWKPAFYPAGLGRARFLEHYAQALGACEINATFYATQKPATLSRWAAATPAPFRFCVKAHRALTYSRWFVPDDDGVALWRGFASTLEPLGDRFGALLAQFPPHRGRDEEALRALLGALPVGPAVAFEFRDEAWCDEAVASLLAERGHCLVTSDRSGDPPAALPPGPIAYVRLRADTYDATARAGWLALLRSEGAGRDVYAFSKHRRGAPAGDDHAGVGLARWLHERLGDP